MQHGGSSENLLWAHWTLILTIECQNVCLLSVNAGYSPNHSIFNLPSTFQAFLALQPPYWSHRSSRLFPILCCNLRKVNSRFLFSIELILRQPIGSSYANPLISNFFPHSLLCMVGVLWSVANNFRFICWFRLHFWQQMSQWATTCCSVFGNTFLVLFIFWYQ